MEGSRVTWMCYAANAQLVEMVDPLGQVISWERDKNGRPLKMTRANGSVVESRPDERSGRLLSRRERTNGASWSFSYDGHGLPTIAADPRGNTTELERDAKGNVVKVRNALGHEISIAYDEAGLPIKLTDPNGQILRRCYDQQGRLERQSEESPNTARSEPMCGQADHRAGLRIWSYEYDEAGRMTKTQTPEGVELTYSYDERNRKQAIVSEISYRADGERTGYLYGNSLSGQRVYNRQGRLLRQDLGVRSAGKWSSKSWERPYQYDKNSNLVCRGPSPYENKQSYGYDELDRLGEEREAGPVVSHLETENAGLQCGEFSGVGWYEEGYRAKNGEGPHVYVDLRAKRSPTNPAQWRCGWQHRCN